MRMDFEGRQGRNSRRGHGGRGHGGHGGWGGRGEAFDPQMFRGGRRMRRGDIRFALLAGLTDGPAHGYELIGRLEARTGGMWRPSAGSVYPTLQLLEEEGLIAGEDLEGKRVYHLTDAGREEAIEAQERWGAGRRGGGPFGDAAEGIVGLRQSIKPLILAARQVALAGDEAQREAASVVLEEARRKLYRILAGDLTGQPDAGSAHPESGPPPSDEK